MDPSRNDGQSRLSRGRSLEQLMGVFDGDQFVLVTMDDEQAPTPEVTNPPHRLHLLETRHPFVRVARKIFIPDDAAFPEVRDDFVLIFFEGPEVGGSSDYCEAVDV
jgi:hypothetical protein